MPSGGTSSLGGDRSIDMSLKKRKVGQSERLGEDILGQKNDVNQGKKSGQCQ